MNPYPFGVSNNSFQRYPVNRSQSSPIPTGQQQQQIGGVIDLGSGGGGNVNMAQEQMLPSSSTPPPNSVPNSVGLPGPPGSSLAVSHNAGTTNSPMSTTNSTTPVNRNAVASSNPSGTNAVNREQVYGWIQELSSPDTREHALIELSRKREVLPDLAPLLWHSFGTIAALLQEIVMIYPVINPPTLNAQQSNRVCNALALLQCVASHPETRSSFLNAHIPLFLYPFLHTVSKSRPFEYLRLTSLGVVGALVKTDEQDVINFLLTTEIIPLCLRIMEAGSELSKTVATFILQKILLDETGLSYICQTFERFQHVSTVLAKMVQQLGKEPSTRLLKHVVRCYLRLSDNLRAREALRACLPEQLKDSTFAVTLKDDSTTKKWLSQLLQNLGLEAMATTTTSGPTSTS